MSDVLTVDINAVCELEVEILEVMVLEVFISSDSEEEVEILG